MSEKLTSFQCSSSCPLRIHRRPIRLFQHHHRQCRDCHRSDICFVVHRHARNDNGIQHCIRMGLGLLHLFTSGLYCADFRNPGNWGARGHDLFRVQLCLPYRKPDQRGVDSRDKLPVDASIRGACDLCWAWVLCCGSDGATSFVGESGVIYPSYFLYGVMRYDSLQAMDEGSEKPGAYYST